MKGTDSSTVLWEIDDAGVLTLTLHRPERHNAWNRELELTLHELLEQAAKSADVRAVVLTGTGRSFSPGLDVDELDRVSQPNGVFEQEGRRPLQLPSVLPKPIVCAINGSCAGLGLVTALACDIRFAADDAKITTAFARRGLPAEEAVSWMLPRIVGHAVALDLLLSGRVVLGAEAAALGLVHRALPRGDLLGAAHEYARDLALHCSPLAMAIAKRQVYLDWERSFAESRRQATRLVAVLKRTGDFREGVRSYVEGRPAVFGPLTDPLDPTHLTGAAP